MVWVEFGVAGEYSIHRRDSLSLFWWIPSCCACVYKGNFDSGVKDKGMRQGTIAFSKWGKCEKNLKEQMLGEGEKWKRRTS